MTEYTKAGVGYTGAKNFCANGDFETDLTGWAGRGPSVSSVARETVVPALFGVASMKVVIGTGWQEDWGVTAPIVYCHLMPYVWSAWIKSDGTHDVTMKIIRKDNGGGSIGMESGNQFTHATEWTRIARVVNPAADCYQAQPLIGPRDSSAVSFTFYVDGAQFEFGPAMTPIVLTNGVEKAGRGAQGFGLLDSVLNKTGVGSIGRI